jgi:S1-C subfamily serine protease
MNASAVVRIYCTSQKPDYDAPWQAQTPSSSTGSGVVLPCGRILTGAHVVANATFVQVQKVDDPTKYTAELVGVCHDADLALLSVDDERFPTGVTPAPLGGLPELRSRVSVVGFPVGGQEVSVTEGIVSRIEVQRYSHSRRRLLAITVDAAINSGNSGGPVFCGDEVVGIAFQSLRDAENIGEVVPTVLVRRFLRAIDEGRPIEVPSLSARAQTLESPTLRAELGMGPQHSGLRIVATQHAEGDDGTGDRLMPDDVLLSIDGHTVANNGTVRYLDRFRTDVPALLGDRFVGDPLPVTVLRDGEEKQLVLTLRPFTMLAPRNRYDVHPRYFVYGGLVFQPLSRDFLATWREWWKNAPSEMLHLYWSGLRTEAVEERVVLSQVLADELTVGYTGRSNEVVATVDGVVPRNLAHLVELVEAATDRLVIETTWGFRVVLRVDEVAERQPAILERYRIPRDRSDEL